MSELAHIPQTVSAMRAEIGELRQLVATLMSRVNELEACNVVTHTQTSAIPPLHSISRTQEMAEGTSIYILRLKGGKYYVGKSDNPLQRYQEHLEGCGSTWTCNHKPVDVVKVIPNASPFDEDKYVKEYMAKYGIDNVRGGSYSQIHLNEEQIIAIEREIRGATDTCMRCGREGHFAHDCYARTDVKASTGKSTVTCYRCGRSGHYVSQCYARTSVDGEELDDDDDGDDDDDEENEENVDEDERLIHSLMEFFQK